jgi:hypothetical protein
MLQYDPNPFSSPFRLRRSNLSNQGSNRPIRARVKPECVHLYPGVNPKQWYAVVQEGEYKDEMEGLWIQVADWVTYVLAKHFDLEARPETH